MKKCKEFAYEKIELCRNCGGTGKVETVDGFRVFKRTSKTETCPVCGGTGRMMKHITGTVEVEPYGEVQA